MTSLDELPFDVLFCIASGLDFDDVVRLSLTCRQLRLLLNESTLCRRTIEVGRQSLFSLLKSTSLPFCKLTLIRLMYPIAERQD